MIRRAAAAVFALLLLSGAPARSRQSGEPIEPDVELFQKSLQAAAEALKIYGEWDEPEQLRRVAEIGYRVAQEANYTDFPLSFYLIDLGEPNAFALPAGQIFVTRGLISIGLADDELAALLGHEIAHVVHRHGIRMERRATLLNLLTQAAVIGVILGAESRGGRDQTTDQLPYPYNVDRRNNSSGDLVTGTYAASLILGELLLRSYSREYEDEADESGQRWAAAAGYATSGTERLMAVLGSRLPDSKEYGYWRTHPFFEQRLAAARARAAGMRTGEPSTADEFRSRSQKQILELGAEIPESAPSHGLAAAAALSAWPRGAEADRLRLNRIHRVRDRTLSRIPISRDYGSLLDRYDREIADVEALDAASPLLARLRSERAALAEEAQGLLPQAQEIWRQGIYETVFLANFLSNWPGAPEVPEVALALGEAYSRTGRQADAVAMFLRAAAAGDEPAAQKARRGLHNLAPNLDQLTALAELASQEQDRALAESAAERLGAVAGSYSDLASGAAYLARFPDGLYAETVSNRLNLLADNLYGEVLLYQGVGDHVKAIERIQKILTFAPTSPAAQRLLERVVLPG